MSLKEIRTEDRFAAAIHDALAIGLDEAVDEVDRRLKHTVRWAVALALIVVALVVGLLVGRSGVPSPIEQEIREQIEQTSSYGLFCADVALYGGIEKYLSGEGGSGTPFDEADWPAFRAIHAAEC